MNRRAFLAAAATAAALPIVAPWLALAAPASPAVHLGPEQIETLKASLQWAFPMRRYGWLCEGAYYELYLEKLSLLEEHGVMTTETRKGLVFETGTLEQVAKHAMRRRMIERQYQARIRYTGDRRRFPETLPARDHKRWTRDDVVL